MDRSPEPTFEDRRAKTDRRQAPDPDYSGDERRKNSRRTQHN